MHRRLFLVSGASMLLAAKELVSTAQAETLISPAREAVQEFSFDWLSSRMKEHSKQAYVAPKENLPEQIAKLSYDDHRAIRFLSDHALWQGEAPVELQAYHPGWLFKNPVTINIVENGLANQVHFSADMFEYPERLNTLKLEHLELPGVAGFHLNYPLNDPQIMDELISFLGASYFRALGRGSFYGISARGLAVNTATSQGEEFPSFTEFWIEKPTRQSKEIIVYAALDSASITGAYCFKITPGQNTVMDVTARLYPRKDIMRLGIAPMTSMFLYADNNRADFDDYRGKVHDSDGFKIVRSNGEEVWRNLNNPRELANSFFIEENPKAFGLYQRDRNFDHYQDAGAGYERRPSLLVEPVGDWGKGFINLTELPTELEVNDNIVAFWVPEADVKAGQDLEYTYRLHWGSLEEANDQLARVISLRSGIGGVSGVEASAGLRKFVIDFSGEPLKPFTNDDEIEVFLTIVKASVKHQALSRVEASGVWRLVIDVVPEGNAPIEISAYLKKDEIRLSEIWSYQWRSSDVRR